MAKQAVRWGSSESQEASKSELAASYAKKIGENFRDLEDKWK